MPSPAKLPHEVVDQRAPGDQDIYVRLNLRPVMNSFDAAAAKSRGDAAVTIEIVALFDALDLWTLGPGRFDKGHFDTAARLYEEMMTSDEFPDFLTLVAYDRLD